MVITNGNNLVADIICSLALVLVFMWVVWVINTLLYRFENGVEEFNHRYRSLRKPNKPYEKNSEDPFESATIPEALSGLTEFDRRQTSPDEKAEQSEREEYWKSSGAKH